MSTHNAAVSTALSLEEGEWVRAMVYSSSSMGNHGTDGEGHPESVASSEMARLAWSHPAQGLSFPTSQPRLPTSHPTCLEDMTGKGRREDP